MGLLVERDPAVGLLRLSPTFASVSCNSLAFQSLLLMARTVSLNRTGYFIASVQLTTRHACDDTPTAHHLILLIY